MPDITMCGDMDCPMANNCYRNEKSGTKPNPYRQSFFMDSPRKEDGTCDYEAPTHRGHP